MGTRARRINRPAALCCRVGLTYGPAILRLEDEARRANFEIWAILVSNGAPSVSP